MINFPYPKIREKRNAKEPNKIEKKNNKIKITIKQEKRRKKARNRIHSHAHSNESKGKINNAKERTPHKIVIMKKTPERRKQKAFIIAENGEIGWLCVFILCRFECDTHI